MTAATRLCAGIAALVGLLDAPARAQTTQWDAAISNTNWYVPVPQLLAYGSPSSGFNNPIPLGDQTLWSFGPATNGAFSGTLSAELSIGNLISPTSMTMTGQVAEDGSVVMIFTPSDGSAQVVGLGQLKSVDGAPAMLMQMVTGSDFLVSHWAYMLTYDPATFTPPPPEAIPVTLSSRQWMWTEGTPWRVVDPALFGSNAPGTFVITNYTNGYFWGKGIGPSGSSGVTYTLLGSMTPDGKVMYNTISDGELASLYGDIRGDADAAAMILYGYGLDGIDATPAAFMQLVSPYQDSVAATGLTAALPAARTLYEVAGTVEGLEGPLAPATLSLNALSGAALSAAIGETLPVLAGAGPRIIADNQRMLQQIIADRLDGTPKGASASARFAGFDAWLRPLGGGLAQSGRDGTPGYSASTGGVAVGLERSVSAGLSLGSTFAYSRSNASGTTIDAPGSLWIDSYVVGLYGSLALTPTIGLDMQLAGGINDNSATRSISFMGSTASADYQGYTVEAGLRLKQSIALSPSLVVTPALTATYLHVADDAYSETGAEGLNLQVAYQAYDEMPLGAEIGMRYGIAPEIAITGHAGVTYNPLDTATAVTARYDGGGDPFVTEGADLSRVLVSAGLGLVGEPRPGTSLGLYYDMQASPTGLLSQAGSLALQLSF